MRNKLSLAALSAVFALFVFSSCQKEGDTGPEGPAGPAGPGGPAGPAGPPGTANVIYSEWLDVIFEPATDTSDLGVVDTVAWLAVIDAPKLDQTILETGEVKVYVNAGTAAAPAVFPLPISDEFALLGIFNMNPFFTEGTINLYGTANASTFEEDGEKAFQYRYVLIPGGVLARKPDNVKLESYSDVQKFLQLKD